MANYVPLCIYVDGEPRTGKDSLYVRFESGMFVDEYDPTIESGYRPQREVDDKICSFRVFTAVDPNSTAQIHEADPAEADGFIFLFDLTSRPSFEALNDRIPKMWERLGISLGDSDSAEDNVPSSPVPAIVVGTKADLCADDGGREVEEDEARAFAAQHGMTYRETSAKTFGTEEAFYDIARIVIEKRAVSDATSSSKKPCTIC